MRFYDTPSSRTLQLRVREFESAPEKKVPPAHTQQVYCSSVSVTRLQVLSQTLLIFLLPPLLPRWGPQRQPQLQRQYGRCHPPSPLVLLPSPLASCLCLLLSHCRCRPGLSPSSQGDTGRHGNYPPGGRGGKEGLHNALAGGGRTGQYPRR